MRFYWLSVARDLLCKPVFSSDAAFLRRLIATLEIGGAPTRDEAVRLRQLYAVYVDPRMKAWA